MSVFDIVNPPPLGRPRGYANGLLGPAGWRVLFVAGQTAADADGRVANRDFTAQFDLALARALAVVGQAGGGPEHIGRMAVYVTDLDAYRRARRAIGEHWRRRMGDHYPAMALLEVSRLVDPDASVEIEVTALIPAGGDAGPL
jgi:enamine deaminase RidA (YjgF/YER057c/UK114 family)